MLRPLGLLAWRRLAEDAEVITTGHRLLEYLSVLFVPAGIGVVAVLGLNPGPLGAAAGGLRAAVAAGAGDDGRRRRPARPPPRAEGGGSAVNAADLPASLAAVWDALLHTPLFGTTLPLVSAVLARRLYRAGTVRDLADLGGDGGRSALLCSAMIGPDVMDGLQRSGDERMGGPRGTAGGERALEHRARAHERGLARDR